MPIVASGRPAGDICEQPLVITNSEPGMPSWAWPIVAGVTSTDSAQNSRVGSRIRPSSPVDVEVLEQPDHMVQGEYQR